MGLFFIEELDQQLKVQYLSDSLCCIMLNCRWCEIISVNVHIPSEEKNDDIKESFYEETDCSINFQY